MSWVQAAVSVLSAVVGGFVGGWVVAFRLGRWRQRTEDRLEHVEEKLDSSDRALSAVPIISARLDVVLSEIREIKDGLRDDRRRFVTHEECDRTHSGGATPRRSA